MAQLKSSQRIRWDINAKLLERNIGNINDPLVQIPMRRANDATRLSGVETFTRADTPDPNDPTLSKAVTYVDPTTGLVTRAALGQPRHERMADGGVGRLLEGTSTNLCLYSEQFDNAAWSIFSMATAPSADTTIAPDGTTTSDTLTFDAVQYSRLNQPAIGAAGTYTLSVWAKVATGTKDFRLAAYNATDGLQSSSDFTATTSWQRFTFTVTVTTATDIHLRNNSTGTAGTLEVWGYQAEALPFASSYIPTTGTALSRAADSYNILASGNVSPNVGAVVFDIETYDISNNTQFFNVSNILYTLSGKLKTYDGSGLVITTQSIAGGVRHRVVFTWNATSRNIYIDGVLEATLATTVPIDFASKTNLFGTFINRIESNLRIYDRELTDQEIGAA